MIEDNPEITRAKELLRLAQLDLTSLNLEDSSNFLDERQKEDKIRFLEENIVKARKNLEQITNH